MKAYSVAAIDTTTTLGALVAERPERASLFERLHLDYCCGGSQMLSEACAARGLDVDTVGAVLAALDADGGAGRQGNGLREPGMEDTDWRRASLEELCSHIVEIHHGRLRRDLPRIDELLARTVRVHAAGHPALRDLQRAFGVIRARLEGRLEDEEKVLFPSCVALERQGIPIEDVLIHANEDEHRDVGERLAAQGMDRRKARLSRGLCTRSHPECLRTFARKHGTRAREKSDAPP